MAVKVFIAGATGYIGGDTLYQLHQTHSDWECALLVRSRDKADKVLEKYPKARIVLGSLDDSETLEKESSWADIVIHAHTSSGSYNPRLFRSLDEQLFYSLRASTGARPQDTLRLCFGNIQVVLRRYPDERPRDLLIRLMLGKTGFIPEPSSDPFSICALLLATLFRPIRLIRTASTLP